MLLLELPFQRVTDANVVNLSPELQSTLICVRRIPQENPFDNFRIHDTTTINRVLNFILLSRKSAGMVAK